MHIRWKRLQIRRTSATRLELQPVAPSSSQACLKKVQEAASRSRARRESAPGRRSPQMQPPQSSPPSDHVFLSKALVLCKAQLRDPERPKRLVELRG